MECLVVDGLLPGSLGFARSSVGGGSGDEAFLPAVGASSRFSEAYGVFFTPWVSRACASRRWSRRPWRCGLYCFSWCSSLPYFASGGCLAPLAFYDSAAWRGSSSSSGSSSGIEVILRLCTFASGSFSRRICGCFPRLCVWVGYADSHSLSGRFQWDCLP